MVRPYRLSGMSLSVKRDWNGTPYVFLGIALLFSLNHMALTLEITGWRPYLR
jgi:hypothetical protein